MTGQEMYELAEELYPLNRSLTGEGTRKTLEIIQRELPKLEIDGILCGTGCFDWTVPDRWDVREAYIEGPDGKRVVDFADHNLHLVGYSEPIDRLMTLEDLQPHLHSRPDMPDAIPYVTSYYKRDWGFCLTENRRQKLQPGYYRVVIDTELDAGYLEWGELIIPGETSEEVLLSTYICHPSMANDGLSGIVVTTALAKWIAEQPRRYTYRILFVPETIGAIAWLSKHYYSGPSWPKPGLQFNVVAGFVVTCCGDDGDYTLIRSRTGDTLADRAAKHVLCELDTPGHERVFHRFDRRGSDERQYCWPGIDLPVVSLMRTRYCDYPEYHTSADDMSVISPEGLEGGYWAIRACLEIIETNRHYVATTMCEPFMEAHGGYDPSYKLAAYCDGCTDTLSIAEQTGTPYLEVEDALRRLESRGIVEKG